MDHRCIVENALAGMMTELELKDTYSVFFNDTHIVDTGILGDGHGFKWRTLRDGR